MTYWRELEVATTLTNCLQEYVTSAPVRRCSIARYWRFQRESRPRIRQIQGAYQEWPLACRDSLLGELWAWTEKVDGRRQERRKVRTIMFHLIMYMGSVSLFISFSTIFLPAYRTAWGTAMPGWCCQPPQPMPRAKSRAACIGVSWWATYRMRTSEDSGRCIADTKCRRGNGRCALRLCRWFWIFCFSILFFHGCKVKAFMA